MSYRKASDIWYVRGLTWFSIPSPDLPETEDAGDVQFSASLKFQKFQLGEYLTWPQQYDEVTVAFTIMRRDWKRTRQSRKSSQINHRCVRTHFFNRTILGSVWPILQCGILLSRTFTSFKCWFAAFQYVCTPFSCSFHHGWDWLRVLSKRACIYCRDKRLKPFWATFCCAFVLFCSLVATPGCGQSRDFRNSRFSNL